MSRRSKFDGHVQEKINPGGAVGSGDYGGGDLGDEAFYGRRDVVCSEIHLVCDLGGQKGRCKPDTLYSATAGLQEMPGALQDSVDMRFPISLPERRWVLVLPKSQC